MSLKKRRFIINALLLTIITFSLRGVSTLFGIYISNKIGAEGMGLYQLISSIYFVAVMLATSGISVAVTRIVSEQVAIKNTRAAKNAFTKCSLIAIVLSIIAGILMFSSAHIIGTTFIKDARTIIPIQILAIGLPFLSIGATIRGYFLGLKCPFKSISGELVEQFVIIIASMILVSLFLPKGIEFACIALMIACVISEIISCLFLFVLYKFDNTKITGLKITGLNNKIFHISFPIAVSNYIRSLLNALENILVPIGLSKFGEGSKTPLEQYGMVKGMVMPILFFPSAILSSFSILLVPEISSANAINEKRRIDFIIRKCFKVTLLFSFLICGIFFQYGINLGELIYKNQSSGNMLIFFAPLIPLIYLDIIVDSILKGLNQQLSSMKYNITDSIMRVLVIYFLVPIMGINGYVIMFYIGTTFNALMSINRLVVVSKVRFDFYRWIILPIVSLITSIILSQQFVFYGFIIQVFLLSIFYIFGLILLKCITSRDFKWVYNIFIRNR